MSIRAIWKFAFPKVAPSFLCEIPIGAEILSVQNQNDVPCIWALVDPNQQARENRFFVRVGTGHEFDPVGLTYRGTAVCNGGSLVWHVFESTP